MRGAMGYSQLPPQFLVVGGVVALMIAAGVAAAIVFFVRHARPQALSWARRSEFLARIPLGAVPLMILIALLMLFYAVMAVSMLALGEFGASEWGFALQTLGFHWTIIIFILIWKRRAGWSWQRMFGFKMRAFTYQASRGMLAYLIVFPLIILSAVLYQWLLISIGYEPTQQPIMDFLSGDISIYTRIYGLLLAVLVAPVAEEFLFRGLLLPVLANRLGVAAAILIVSLVFAGMHLFIPALLPLFLVSVACSLAYIYTGSLTTAIVFHSIFNSVNLALFTVLHEVVL